jgi:chaperonin GroEL (HSP60 family)
VEVKERKDRVDDALHATRAAVEEGIVPGGGVALARASKVLASVKAENDDQRFGIEIVRKAALMPLRQIAENSGEDGAVVAGKVLDNQEYNWGFDAQTSEFKDLVGAGIIDPTKVVRTALQDASSVAGLLITTEAMVAEKPEKKAPPMPPGGGVALARASLILAQLKCDNDDQRFGIDIVRKAIQAPLRQIAENSGEDGAVVAGKVLDNQEYNWGFDAQTSEFKDLVSAGIIDPTKVVRTALQDASSVAGLLVTTEAMVAEKPEKKTPPMPPGGGGMGDMDF